MIHRLFLIPLLALSAHGAIAATPMRSGQVSGSVATATISVGLVGELVMTAPRPEAAVKASPGSCGS